MVTWPAIQSVRLRNPSGEAGISASLFCTAKCKGILGIAAAMRIVMPLMNGASWHDKHKGRRIMSRHESYISKDGAFHFIHRQKGGRYEVLRYRLLENTDQNV